jgi:hypothetical protein
MLLLPLRLVVESNHDKIRSSRCLGYPTFLQKLLPKLGRYTKDVLERVLKSHAFFMHCLTHFSTGQFTVDLLTVNQQNSPSIDGEFMAHNLFILLLIG